MKVLIVEDEKVAVRRLRILLEELVPGIEIAGVCDTASTAISWLNSQSADLAFFDIQLADTLSFSVFEHADVDCPVIFTTAYDQYALKAFEVNSIDYLLKPIQKEQLERALKKYHHFTGGGRTNQVDMETLNMVKEMIRTGGFKERFVVRYGDHLKSIPIGSICFFKSEAKATFLFTAENKKYLTDHSLDQVEKMVDPVQYFRINRKFLIRFNAIRDIVAYSNSRLRLVMENADEPDMIVAREKVVAFKAWLDR